MKKIQVKQTSIVIHNYELGDCPKLEYYFTIYDPVRHVSFFKGIEYDEENKDLYLPRGLDIYWLEHNLACEASLDRDKDKYEYTSEPILLKELPRDDVQKEALRFVLGKGEYSYTANKSQLSVNLDTGKGKTYVTVASISMWCIKTIIITYSIGLLTQWKEKILSYTNLTNKNIYLIEGASSIRNIMNRDISNYSIFLVSHSTLKSYGDTYGWDKVSELFKYLKVGLKVYDEAHLNFDNLLKIDYHTNTYKTLYLTATPARSNSEENDIFKLAFKTVPKIDLFDEETDPHTDYIAIHFNSHPSPVVISQCKNAYGLNRTKYTDYLSTNKYFQNMCHIIIDIINKIDGRTLIYIGTNNAIMNVYNWIGENYPEIINDVGIYSSLITDVSKREMELSKRIILSTTKSCGAGKDIPELKCTVILDEPFKSEILAKQTIGRLRASNTKYIDLVDNGFYYTKKYFQFKKPLFLKYAQKCQDIVLNDFEIENRVNKIKESRMPKIIDAIERL